MNCVNCGLEIIVCPGKDAPEHLYNNDGCVGYKHKLSNNSWDLWHSCRRAQGYNGLPQTVPTYDIYNKEVNARPDVKQIFTTLELKEPETSSKPQNQKQAEIVQDIIEIVEIPTRRKFKNIS